MASKVDFKKEFKKLYSAPNNPVTVLVPELKYIMIDGSGSPGECKEYTDAISALYPVAYITKFASKKGQKKDYAVPPLEGLWWADDMADFVKGNRSKWKWTMMIMQPDWITKDLIKESIAKAKQKNPSLVKTFDKIRFDAYNEGKSGQIMHTGPYKDEGPTIKKLHGYIKEQKGTFDGQKEKHHEIYLSDPRRSKPERMKTIIRQPFK